MNFNRKLSEIAKVEFSDVVAFADDSEEKLRCPRCDSSTSYEPADAIRDTHESVGAVYSSDV